MTKIAEKLSTKKLIKRIIICIVAICLAPIAVFQLYIFIIMLSGRFAMDDDFGKNIIVPPDMKVETVGKTNIWDVNDLSDLMYPIQGLDEINAIVFTKFGHPQKDLILRYFSTNSQWKLLTTNPGDLIAVKRRIQDLNYETSYLNFANKNDKTADKLIKEGAFDFLLKQNLPSSTEIDLSILPRFSVREGPSELKVHRREADVGGYYCVDAFINPGEYGCSSVKLFEATKNTPIKDMSQDKCEHIGWSRDQDKKYFFGQCIKVYAGRQAWTYPARFEIWFQPVDKTKEPQKLIEKIYSISGWSH